MRNALCICAEVPRIETATRVVLLMHLRETYSTTNTGRIAHLALPNSEIRIRGTRQSESASKGLEFSQSSGLVLFPSEDAEELDSELAQRLAKPITLVVPDGNWRQASRMVRREPGLKDYKCVKLKFTAPSRYYLRKAPSPESLATLEAVARALAVLEGPEVQQKLERLFQLMVVRTLSTRGQISNEAQLLVRQAASASLAKSLAHEEHNS